MLHHVEIYVSSLSRTFAFWSELLSPLDYRVTSRWEDGFSLGAGSAYLTFVQVGDRDAGRPYHRCAVGLNHLAFSVGTRADVDAIRLRAQERGWPLLYDDRYPFANGGSDYYAVYLEDPDRIKVEFVAKEKGGARNTSASG